MQPAPAPRFQRTTSALPAAAPEAGAHTAALLRKLGRNVLRLGT